MNYIYNALWIAAGQLVVAAILYIAPNFELLRTFTDAPLLAQWLIAFVVMIHAFIFVMWLKSTRKWLETKWKYADDVVGVVFGYPFAFADIQFNVNICNVIFWQSSNHDGEGWLLTSRLRMLIDIGEYELGEGIKPDWRYYRAVQLCKIIDGIDPGHCGRKLK